MDILIDNVKNVKVSRGLYMDIEFILQNGATAKVTIPLTAADWLREELSK